MSRRYTVDQLIDLARTGNPDSYWAIQEISERRDESLGKVIGKFEEEPHSSPGLEEAILLCGAEDTVDTLFESAVSGSIPLAELAMHSLARASSDAAESRLMQLAGSGDFLETRSRFAASALGEVRNNQTTSLLKEIIDKEEIKQPQADNPYSLLISSIVSLAKHGDHSRSHWLLDLASPNFPYAQEAAVDALTICVSDGMIETLDSTLKSELLPAIPSAATALAYLGDSRCLETLEEATHSNLQSVRDIGAWRCGTILGLDHDTTEAINAVRTEVARALPRLTSGVVYRLGEPSSPLNLARFATSIKNRAQLEEIGREIETISGVRARRLLKYGKHEELVSSISRLNFEEGKLYKWGFCIPLPRH